MLKKIPVNIVYSVKQILMPYIVFVRNDVNRHGKGAFGIHFSGKSFAELYKPEHILLWVFINVPEHAFAYSVKHSAS